MASKLYVAQITGLTPNFTVTIPEETDLLFNDANLSGKQYIPLPYGTTAQFINDAVENSPRKTPNGMIKFNTTLGKLEVYYKKKSNHIICV